MCDLWHILYWLYADAEISDTHVKRRKMKSPVSVTEPPSSSSTTQSPSTSSVTPAPSACKRSRSATPVQPQQQSVKTVDRTKMKWSEFDGHMNSAIGFPTGDYSALRGLSAVSVFQLSLVIKFFIPELSWSQSGWVSSFLTAHQHIIGHSVP